VFNINSREFEWPHLNCVYTFLFSNEYNTQGNLIFQNFSITKWILHFGFQNYLGIYPRSCDNLWTTIIVLTKRVNPLEFRRPHFVFAFIHINRHEIGKEVILQWSSKFKNTLHVHFVIIRAMIWNHNLI
jgi:hypothetical protein